MCTILLVWRCFDDAPVVLAANRDELIARASLPPGILARNPTVAGGRDLFAGGTWLAVSEAGRIAAVTNRRSSERDSTRRSRGEIPLRLLETTDDRAATDLLARHDPRAYNPFNALYVSADTAVVAHARDGHDVIEVVHLAPGPHVITVHDTDDVAEPKVRALLGSLEASVAAAADGSELLTAMEELLRDHGEDGRSLLDHACVHGGAYGTVSSSSLVVHSDGAITYRHAAGRPCETPFVDVGDLLKPTSRSRPRPGMPASR